MKIFISISFLLIISSFTWAQSVEGVVQSSGGEPLIGATVRQLGVEGGTVTDVAGHFRLVLSGVAHTLIVSYIGYTPDTVETYPGQYLKVVLEESASELSTVTVESASTFMDVKEVEHKEVITEKELLKSACCNLSESFETNASVDVSFTDAISGAKVIKMLGLDGRYTLISRENIPLVRGLSSSYGLSYLPGTWIQSIDVGKGAGTVVNGFESMTGQINVELKKPEIGEKLYLNAYGNSFGRVEINANTSLPLGKRWSTAVLTHANYFNNERDVNSDGFMDLPKSRQFNVMNRYKFQGENLESQMGIHVMRDQKAGGQLGFDFSDNVMDTPIYGFSNNTLKAEIFGKTGLMFPSQPYKGWGFIYSASLQDIESGFGRRSYTGKERTLFGNLIHQNIFGTTIHQYKTGVSVLVDDFKEVFNDSAFSRMEIVPGSYFEYSFIPSHKMTLLLGGRVDYHNLYGWYWLPRFHARYEFTEESVVRLSVGKGYRTSNVVAENSQVFVSARELTIAEPLKPEVAWNMGGSLTHQVGLGEKKLNLIADYFYTHFENQIVMNLDQSADRIYFSNLSGRSFAHSFQIEGSYKITDNWSAKAAYKYYDVRATIGEAIRQVPFISKDRFFVNTSYSSRNDIWQMDLTTQWFGKKRLPDTSDKPLEFQVDSYSPDFFVMNAQVSKKFRWGQIYLGGENLLDFRQKQPIIDPENPFGGQFDASLVWGPVAGRVLYSGIRFKIK